MSSARALEAARRRRGLAAGLVGGDALELQRVADDPAAGDPLDLLAEVAPGVRFWQREVVGHVTCLHGGGGRVAVAERQLDGAVAFSVALSAPSSIVPENARPSVSPSQR